MIWQDRYLDMIYTTKIAVDSILSKCRIMPVDNISSISKTLNDMPWETGFFLDAAFKIMPLKKVLDMVKLVLHIWFVMVCSHMHTVCMHFPVNVLTGKKISQVYRSRWMDEWLAAVHKLTISTHKKRKNGI